MISPKDASRSVNANLFIFIGFLSPLALAGEVEIVDAKADCQDNVCRFDVTLEHADTGWEHYANSWRIVTDDGQQLGIRRLLHPHVDEQPFTRSLSGVEIPADINRVWIEANDSVHGVSPQRFEVDIPR